MPSFYEFFERSRVLSTYGMALSALEWSLLSTVRELSVHYLEFEVLSASFEKVALWPHLKCLRLQHNNLISLYQIDSLAVR